MELQECMELAERLEKMLREDNALLQGCFRCDATPVYKAGTDKAIKSVRRLKQLMLSCVTTAE